MRTPAARAGALAVLLVVVAPGLPEAEAQPGFYATPSLSLAEVYDDNLFSTPTRRQRDFITRVSPALEAGYRSAPLTLLGRYGFDAELYAEHPELNDAQTRQEASVDLQSRPTPTLRLGLTGLFRETQIAGELNLESGLTTGRVRGQRVSLAGAAGWRLGPRTEVSAEAEAADDELEGGIGTKTYTAGGRLERELTARDAGRLGYTVRRFVFDGDETQTSQAALVGWRHAFTPRTSLELSGGPRFTDGSVDPEVSASFRHELRGGELSLMYARTETTAIGQVGTLTTDSATALAVWEPRRSLRVRAAPSVVRVEQAGLDATVYSLSLGVSYRVTRFVALEASYGFALQRGSTVPTTRPDQEITRNIVVLMLTFTSTHRLR
jgi:hypothetical protein